MNRCTHRVAAEVTRRTLDRLTGRIRLRTSAATVHGLDARFANPLALPMKPPSLPGMPLRMNAVMAPAGAQGTARPTSPKGAQLQLSVFAILLIGLALVAGHGPAVLGATLPEPDVRRDAVVAAVEKVLPAVVNIGTLTVERGDPYDDMLREFFGYRRRAPDTVYSSGSGVIVDEEGWVLTNSHVVREAARIRVTLADATEPIEAELVAMSAANDLALLRLRGKPGQKFRAVTLAAEDDLLLGETVLALGNPYGLGGSVSRGILSSKTRRPEQDGEAMAVEDWLQTDASINPGNSGGPLVNLAGELIGLNVAILARAQGIGFAIPVKRVAAAVGAMLAPEVSRGLWFGATLRGTRLPLLVTEVQRGSPADTAGLEPGDLVFSLNGATPGSAIRFYRELGAGESPTVTLGVRRGSRRRELTVRMVSASTVFNADYLGRRLGAALERIPEDVARQLRIEPGAALWVSTVERGGPAARAGLERGHLITAIDGQRVVDIVAVGRQLQRKRAGDTATLDVLVARRRGMVVQVSEGRVEVMLR